MRTTNEDEVHWAVLLPGLCSVIFIVALFQVLFLSRGTEGLFRDSDTGWHLRNGEAQKEDGDRWSVTRFEAAKPLILAAAKKIAAKTK